MASSPEVSEDNVASVAKHRAGAMRPEAEIAPTSGRRRLMRKREERVGAAEREAEIDVLRVRKEAQASVLGRERERWKRFVAMAESTTKRWSFVQNPKKRRETCRCGLWRVRSLYRSRKLD